MEEIKKLKRADVIISVIMFLIALALAVLCVMEYRAGKVTPLSAGGFLLIALGGIMVHVNFQDSITIAEQNLTDVNSEDNE